VLFRNGQFHRSSDPDSCRDLLYRDDTQGGPRLDVLIHRPAASDGAVPAFLGLNFFGNHSIHTDPAIIHEHWEGDADVLDLTRQILAVADTMVGGPLWRRLIARAESFAPTP